MHIHLVPATFATALITSLHAVSVTLLSPPVENGLRVAAETSEGIMKAVTIDGKPAWRCLPGGSSGKFCYAAITDTTLKNGAAPSARFSITYYDEGSGELAVEYDSLDAATIPGAFKPIRLAVLGDSKLWKTAEVTVTDARFGGRCNGKDFRIIMPKDVNIAFSSLAVTAITVSPEEKLAAKKKIEKEEEHIFNEAIFIDNNRADAILNRVSDDTSERNKKLLEVFLKEKLLAAMEIPLVMDPAPERVSAGDEITLTFRIRKSSDVLPAPRNLYVAIATPEPSEPETTIVQTNIKNAFKNGVAVLHLPIPVWADEKKYSIIAKASTQDSIRLNWRGWIESFIMGTVTVLKPAIYPAGQNPDTHVGNYKGRKVFFIHNKPVMPIFFACGRALYDRTWDIAATSGFDLLRFVGNFGSFPRNADGTLDFSQLDKNMRIRLGAAPDARFMILATPEYYFASSTNGTTIENWLDIPENEKLVIESNHGTIPKERKTKKFDVPSFASPYYKSMISQNTKALVRHILDSPYADRLFGLCLEAENETYPPEYSSLSGDTKIGDYSESMRRYFIAWLKEKYVTVEKLQAVWERKIAWNDIQIPVIARRNSESSLGVFRAPRQSMDVIDFQEAYNNHMVDMSAAIGSSARELCGNKYILNTYYRITPNNLRSPKTLSHMNLSLGRMLNTKAWDMIVGCPSRYYYHAGGISIPLICWDSYLLHGVIPVVEYDATGYMAQRNPLRGRLAEGGRQENARETREIYKRDTAAYIIEGLGYYHMQFDEGNSFEWGMKRVPGFRDWWNAVDPSRLNQPLQVTGEEEQLLDRIRADTYMLDESVVAVMRRMKEIGTRMMELGLERTADMVLIYDPESLHYMTATPALSESTAHFQHQMRRSGIPYHEYLLSDFLHHPDFPEYKVYIFYNCYHISDEDRAIIARKLRKNSKTAVWLYASGLISTVPDSKNMTDLTGIRIRALAENHSGAIRVSANAHGILNGIPKNQLLGTMKIINPIFSVHDPDATILGTWDDNNEPAFALKQFPEWTSIYFGSVYLSYQVIRTIAKAANIHCYSDGDDVVFANRNMIMVHSFFSGEKKIALPRSADVYDWFSKSVVARGTREFTVHLDSKETGVYYYGDLNSLRQAGEEVPR
ncbi:MAG: beta-galactosidase [Spirochaetes bacterium]|nr:beta-galactosidase [Spirochaetota bacterium]